MHFVYQLADELIAAHHPHLAQARIAFAYSYSWDEDADGRLTLGKVKRAGDLDRDLHQYDFVILLNKLMVSHQFTLAQTRALIDHQLCHCEVARNDAGEIKVDEADRTVYRIRRHDIEEFSEVVARHGLWMKDLEHMAAIMAQHAREPLLQEQPAEASG